VCNKGPKEEKSWWIEGGDVGASQMPGYRVKTQDFVDQVWTPRMTEMAFSASLLTQDLEIKLRWFTHFLNGGQEMFLSIFPNSPYFILLN
jgi:hypothetical protein